MQYWVIVQVFHLYDVEFGLCWVMRVLVFHPSWCQVTVVRFNAVVWAWVGMVEIVGFYQVIWLVMLEFAKNRILGVDTLGQQVPPRVQYGIAFLLIRDDVESVLLGWVRSGMVIRLSLHGARGVVILWTTPKNICIAMVLCTTLAKPSIRPIVNVCNEMQWSLGHTPKEV
jgi:hypothetical protein